MTRRLGLWLAIAAAGLLGGALVGRWLSFEPEAQARALWAQVNPVAASDLGGLRTIAHAASLGDVAEGLDHIDVDALMERLRVSKENVRALRQRFHHGTARCARYPDEADAPADPEEAAHAIVSAGFAPRLEQLLYACASRLAERDDSLHDEDEAAEVVDFLSERADLWTRLGLRLRRGATVVAVRALVPPRRPSSLSVARAQEAIALCDRYGSPMSAVMLVAKQKQRVDLTAAEAHLIHPGMTQAEVRERLGDPAQERAEWTYQSPATRVRFDAAGHVSAVTSPIPDWAPMLFAGEVSLTRTDRDAVVAALGAPAWLGDGDMRAAADADEILGYDRAPYALLLYFLGGKLQSVELRFPRGVR